MDSPAFRLSHPVAILRSAGRYFWVLLVPILRGIPAALRGGGLLAWFRAVWTDFIIIGLLLLAAILRWSVRRYRLTERGIEIREGLFFRRRAFYPYRRMATLAVERPARYDLVGAAIVRGDTLAGGRKNFDWTLVLPKDEAAELIRRRTLALGVSPEKPDGQNAYRPGYLQLAALAFLLSNTMAAVLFSATFVSRLGDLIGRELEEQLVGRLTEWVTHLIRGIPPAAALLAVILLASNTLAFFSTLIRYRGFAAERDGRQLSVRGGILTRRSYRIDIREVNALEIRQSLLTRAAKLSTVFVSSAGFGKLQRDMTVLIPAAPPDELGRVMAVLAPEFLPTERQIRPTGIQRYLFPPFMILLALLAMSALSWRLFPDWFSLILWVGGMGAVPALWFLLLSIADFRSAGVARTEGAYTIRYGRGFHLKTVTIPMDRLTSVTLRQNILQRPDDLCDLLFEVRGEGWRRHCVKNLRRAEAAALLDSDAPIAPGGRDGSR